MGGRLASEMRLCVRKQCQRVIGRKNAGRDLRSANVHRTDSVTESSVWRSFSVLLLLLR